MAAPFRHDGVSVPKRSILIYFVCFVILNQEFMACIQISRIVILDCNQILDLNRQFYLMRQQSVNKHGMASMFSQNNPLESRSRFLCLLLLVSKRGFRTNYFTRRRLESRSRSTTQFQFATRKEVDKATMGIKHLVASNSMCCVFRQICWCRVRLISLQIYDISLRAI